ncbi:hypothetical protein ILUMI_16926 [Ignelater luminosus]|uniref:Uncharacterized protein n=1 Tax=Ignelater luminosus TaxID=2038154 RepID=A0A8K0CQ23_IGNLU|nr:hypothetical protein ILUMI_16926 [Ignelater luminosus]
MLDSSSEDKSQETPESGSADAALKKELLSYRNKKRVNINENPLKWWRVPREELKDLSPISRRFLSSLPASVPSKQLSAPASADVRLHALAQTTVQRLKAILVSRECPWNKKGKHKTRPQVLPREAIIKIQEHIASFPTKTTHYGSKDISYLDARFTAKTRHVVFIKVGFGRPHVDVRSSCEALGVKLRDARLNNNTKRVSAAKLIVHKRRAKRF